MQGSFEVTEGVATFKQKAFLVKSNPDSTTDLKINAVFTNIDELAKMICAASVQNEVNGIINVCTGEPMSLADKVESFIKEHNFKIKLKYGAFPDRPYDSPGEWGDATLIKKIMEKA